MTGSETVERPASRPPDRTMTREAMGSVWPTKFSFSESFLRRAARELGRLEVDRWEIDADGDGVAVYSVVFGGRRMSVTIFSTLLDPGAHQDRIIATDWDFKAALTEGTPSAEDREEMRVQLPRVLDGRAVPGTLVWSRANRSSRLFDTIVDALASGRQPPVESADEVGYLVRTTSFAANGRNGMVEYAALRATDHPLRAPYHAQMLLSYVWREFGCRLAEHVAAQRSPAAVSLSREVRRRIGVGNSSGIGLVPFLVRHPRLVHRWVALREDALARIASRRFDDAGGARLAGLLERARTYFAEQRAVDVSPFCSPAQLALELDGFLALLPPALATDATAGELLDMASATASREGVEVLVAMLLEADPEPVDPDDLHAPDGWGLPEGMSAGALLHVVESAAGPYLDRAQRSDHFWYLSEENSEPRRGRRGVDPGEEVELHVDVPGALRRLREVLRAAAPSTPLAWVLLEHPECADAAAFAAGLRTDPYALVRVDLLEAEFAPIELMRFQLALYGMNRFRPSSDSQLRATLFQGAPLPDELFRSADHGSLFVPRRPAVG